VIIKESIKKIVSAEIGSRITSLTDINTADITKKIEDCFLDKYGISINNMLGGSSYKINTGGELMFAIDDGKEFSSNIRGLKNYLKTNYKIEMKLYGREILYKHPQDNKYISGDVLGRQYSVKALRGSFLGKSGKGNKKSVSDSISKTDTIAKSISMER
jgi:hypothetical protein